MPGAAAALPAADAAACVPAPGAPEGPDAYDVRRFGAIWDGRSHPLSGCFASLAEARRVYPHAASLDDEIDWAATQAAIDRIVLDWSRAGGRYGGVVRLPGGTGRFNRSLFYPANPVWVWKDFPVASLVGQGRTSTILEWRDNAAPIFDGFVLQPRLAEVVEGRVVWSGDHASLHADCRLEGFALRGPGSWRDWAAPTSRAEFVDRYGFDAPDWTRAFNAANPPIGQVYERYGGISAGERTCVTDVFVSGFDVGLNWRGGQKTARLVFTQNCHYGVRLTFAEAAHGDFLMEKCNFSGRFAAIALAPDAAWYGHMDTCFVGGAPYAVYKEGTPEALPDALAAATIGGHWRDFAAGIWTHCQFESVGNAIFAEGNLTRRHELRDLTLQNCLFREVSGTDTSFPTTARGRSGAVTADALVDVARWRRVSILRSHDPDRWTPRAVATFAAQEPPEDVRLDGADAYLRAAAAAGKPFFAVGGGPDRAGSVQVDGAGWSGALHPVPAGARAALEVGDLVGAYGAGCGAMTPGADALVGVAQEANPDPSRDQHLIVATEAARWIGVNMAEGAEAPDRAAGWGPSQAAPGKAAPTEDRSHGVTIGPGPDGRWLCALRR